MKEEEGAFPEACSLGAEMRAALGWRRLKEQFAKAWCGGEVKTEVQRDNLGGMAGWQHGRLSLAGKGCALFISQELRNRIWQRDVRKSYVVFSLQMFSRVWEQAGLLSNDSSLCGCSKPMALQEEILVVFLWGSVQAPPRKKALSSSNFWQWSGIAGVQQSQGCTLILLGAWLLPLRYVCPYQMS